MSIHYTYDEDTRTIHSTCDEVLTTEDIRIYFEALLGEKGTIQNAREEVDFTQITKFESTHEKFWTVKHLYSQIAREKIIAQTVFKVANPYQFGMARMYSSMADDAGTEFGFEFVGWNP